MSLLRPLPETNGFADAFWKAAAEEVLLIQKCRACGRHQHYARPVCLKCGSEDLDMVPAAGGGRILSFTAIHRSPYSDIVMPYVVALVRLDEEVTLLSHIVDADPASLACDMRVRVAFVPLREGVKLPVFRLEVAP